MIAIIGYYGHGNVGDRAMLTCWLDAFDRMRLKSQVLVFTADPESTTRRFGVQAMSNVLPLSRFSYLRGYLGRNRRNFLRVLKAYKQCHMLLVGGGGLFQDRPNTSKHLLGLLREIEIALNAHQKVLVLGVSVGPIYREESIRALRRVLSRVDAISLRDTSSRQLFEELNIKGPEVSTTADPAFLLDPPNEALIDKLSQVEGITAFSGPKIALCLRTADLKNESFKSAVTTLCRYMSSDLNAGIWFFPMQVGGGEDDRIEARRIIQDLGSAPHLKLTDHTHGPLETMGLLSRMDMVVGEKLHSMVFSVCTSTPFLAISYAPKVRALAHDIGHDDWCIDLSDVKSEYLRERFDSLWSNRKKVREEIASLRGGLRRRAEKNVAILERHVARLVLTDG